jgi:glutathione S-transferase
MITVHHLEMSRSQRILWLLEELGVPYDIRLYRRDPASRLVPVKLKRIHPPWANRQWWPHLAAYRQRLQARLAYQRALQKGGPVLMSS